MIARKCVQPTLLVQLALIVTLLLVTGCSAALTFDQSTPSTATIPPQSAETQAAEQGENSACGRTPGACVAEELLISVVDYLTLFAELCGAFVIAVGVMRALFNFLPHLLRREQDEGEYKEDIRLQLGKSLALALEFELGADILKTAVAPTFPIIVQLAAIIILRTALNYFLERELRQVEQRRANLHLDSKQQPGEPEPLR